MNTVTSRQVSSRQLAVPNLLTYARIAAVPAVVACLYWQDILQGGLWQRWVALAIFISAGVTDALDGYFARKRGEQSAFGRMLDPIADKLLVASCLLMLAADGTIRGWSLWAANSPGMSRRMRSKWASLASYHACHSPAVAARGV